MPPACPKTPVEPTTLAVPENETTFAPGSLAHARAPCTTSRKEPCRPASLALPLKTTQVAVVNVPVADPVKVPAPMGLPVPRIVALPEAFPLLT